MTVLNTVGDRPMHYLNLLTGWRVQRYSAAIHGAIAAGSQCEPCMAELHFSFRLSYGNMSLQGLNVMPGHRRGVFFRRPSGGISVWQDQVRVKFVVFFPSLSCYFCSASQNPALTGPKTFSVFAAASCSIGIGPPRDKSGAIGLGLSGRPDLGAEKYE